MRPPSPHRRSTGRGLFVVALWLGVGAGTAAAEPGRSRRVGAAPAARAASPPADRQTSAARRLLRAAIDLYVAGRYRQAAAVLRPLVEARVLKDRDDQLEALRIYGTALYLSGGRIGAEQAFRHLLRLDPRTRLDRSFVRPEVVTFFEGVRLRFGGELDRVVRRHAPRGSAMVNLLVPWGQFRNGHRTKGYVLLGGELALAATSITTAALLYRWQGSDHTFPGHEGAAEPLSIVNGVSFAALAGLVIYGIVDGLYHYYRGPQPALDAPAADGKMSHGLHNGIGLQWGPDSDFP